MFYNAHVRSHIDYASTVWDGCGDVHLKRLDSLNRRAAKLIVPDINLTTDQKMGAAGMLSLHNHFSYNKGVFMHKIWNQKTPAYLTHFFKQSESSFGEFNRLFIVPRTRIDIFKSSLSFAGASLWNALPFSLKTTSSLARFKVNLFKYLSSS